MLRKVSCLIGFIFCLGMSRAADSTKNDRIEQSLFYLVGYQRAQALIDDLRSRGYLAPSQLEEKSYLWDSVFQKGIILKSKTDISWLFESYKQNELPNLIVNQIGDSLLLSWDCISSVFPFPLEIVLDGVSKVCIFKNDTTLSAKNFEIDPNGRLLLKSTWREKSLFRQKLLKSGHIKSLYEINARDHFTQSYHVVITQPLDHDHVDIGSFDQHVYLSHAACDKPMLMETCGYEAYDYTKEIALMTKGNQLIIENRYFGNSNPLDKDWQYLRNSQSMRDLHRINEWLRTVYTGKFISSGISKGGANSIAYRAAYPNDVDVTVPYVAPIALKREDERTNLHINAIGDKWCRDSVFAFQRRILLRKDSLLILLNDWAKTHNKHFSIELGVVIEYAAYEYPFSFWQWLGDCEAIPGIKASTLQVFNHVNSTVGWSFYSDYTIERLGPSYYQHMVELGYYGFETDKIIDLCTAVKQPDNYFFTPDRDQIPLFDDSAVKRVWNYATHEGNRFIYVYGEYDTWSACAITPDAGLDALKMVVKGGNHGVRIKDLNAQQQELVCKKLEEWLEMKIEALKN